VLVDSWRPAGTEIAPQALRIALPRGPGSDLIFDRLRQDLAAIGLPARLVGEDAKAELRLVDESARYARAAWFLNRFNCGVRRALCDAGADALMNEVRAADDPEVRARLLREAAASLTAANVFIPIARAPLRWSLVRGDAIGFATNRIGWHPLMPMALKPR
jgi:ABC-type transport system substrate-binding protein